MKRRHRITAASLLLALCLLLSGCGHQGLDGEPDTWLL